MIELHSPEEIDEAYILDLHEYLVEYSKALYVFIKSSKDDSDDGVSNVPSDNEFMENEGLHLFDRNTKRDLLILTHNFTQVYPPLNKYNALENPAEAMVGVALFLNDVITAAEETYGQLSREGEEKVEKFTAVRAFVWHKIDTWFKLEKMLAIS